MGALIRVPEGFVAESRENGIHVSPVGDLWPHHPLACSCHPAGHVDRGGLPVYIHNRFDGADLVAAIERGQPLLEPKPPARPSHGGYPDFPPHRDRCG